MYNTYFSYSSSIRSLRTTYVSFNDYPNERCASNYYCSCCCSFPVNSSRLNINPNLSLYGLRQSTLINFPPSRRKLVLGSKSANDRFCCRSSIYDSGCCSGCCCCVKNWGNCKENCNRIDSVDKIRVRVRVSAIRRDLRCNSVGDAEAMLSLLSDGQSESNKQNVVIGKYEDDMKDDNVLWGSGYLERRRVKERLESTRDCSRKKGYRRSGERERESIMTDDPLSESGVYEDVKDDVLWRSGYLETRLMKERLESKRDCSRKEGYKRRGERERLDKFEYDDEDDEVKHERFVGESLGKKRKELRKMGGVVISEVTSDVLESRKDEKGEKLGSSRVENVKLGSSTEWDWRKKSEKKLTDVSNEFTRSKEESIMNKSKLSRVNESSSFMGSSSKKRFSDVEEELTSDVSSRRQSRASTRKDDGVSESITDIRLHELSKSRIETGNQVSEQFVSSNAQGQSTSVASSSGQLKSRIRIDSQETDYNQSSQTNRQNVESTSKTMVRHVSEQGAVVVDQLLQETGCDHCKTCGRSLQEKQAEFDSKRHTEVSEFHGDARHSTFVQSESESRRDKQETSTSSSQTLVKETSKKRDESHLTGAQVDAGIVSGNYSETMGSDYSSEQSRLSLQKQPEMHIQILEGNSTSVEHDNKKLQEGSSDPQVLSTSVEINRHSASSKINDEKSYSTSKFKSVKESVEKHKLVHETFVQSGNFSGDAKVNIGSSSQTGVPKVSEVEAKSEASEMPPSFQLTEIVSSGSDPESGLVRRNSTGRTTGIDSDVGYSRPQARRSSSPDAEFVSGTEFVEESSEDAISSLERMHESSAHIVGEFVETMRHDSSASKTEIHEELSQVDEATFVKQHLSHLSGGSRPSSTKGEESLEGEIAETVVAKRTGKSLWNAVSRPFRLQWGSSSETKKSPIKSSQQQRLSNESESDETWFSGNEHDEGNDDSMKQKEQITSLQEPTSDSRSRPPLRETSSRRRKKDRTEKKQRHTTQEPILDQSLLRSSTNESQKGDFGTPSLDDRPGSGEGYVASSASASQDVSISGSVSIGSNTDLKMTQQTLVSSPSSSLTPSAGRLRRSDAFEETDEIGKRLSSTSEQISELKGGVSMDVMESGFPALEETDAQRKQRKLLRSKQVLSDRFDEWEDAYARENEVRKVDENFMREALAEALKAADSWEVPVGAVLVQSGKIIARGYNLVEGLRDSTAHAEMICIREASNVLRTWRLSETTLYVTLEPCPMCAGAILQARIGTLVWGAPNKLLGADGSWIRLFPEGVEGGERSEVADKPAAPAHPFHPKMTIRRGVLESECGQVMQQFFQLRRKKDKESKDNKSDDEGQPSCLPVPHNPAKLLRKMHGVLRRT